MLALATLLAVRARTLSNGVNGYYGTTAGGDRYAKLDRFLHDRMGLGGNRSEEPPVLTTDRGLLSKTTAASVAVPEDEDDGGGNDDDDDDEEEDEELTRKTIRLRHWNRWEEENALYDKVMILL